jgi:hypothetical protein
MSLLIFQLHLAWTNAIRPKSMNMSHRQAFSILQERQIMTGGNGESE